MSRGRPNAKHEAKGAGVGFVGTRQKRLPRAVKGRRL